jgi:hypothetical protein
MAAEALDSLAQYVLGSSNRELKLLAARGLLPLTPGKLIPVQVALTLETDPEIAGRARAALRATEPEVVADFITHEAAETHLQFFAGDAEHPRVVEALLRRRDLPLAYLRQMAERVPVEAQEILILRQDAIVEAPEILDALEANPRLDSSVRRRIQEYREHMFRPVASVPSEDEQKELSTTDEATQEEVVAAIAEVKKKPAKGDLDDTTGLTEGQIRLLPVPVRRRLSRGASRTLRAILVRDANPMVAVSVLVNNRIGDEEAEQIARNRSVCDDVLQEIGRRREFITKLPVVNALVSNPRTPVGISVRLVNRLGMRDLMNLSRNRNVPDAVRSTARRLYTVKSR